MLLSLIYDTLTWKDESGLIPWLATRWEVSSDGMSYRFVLREGVNWQDGRPLTNRDAAFTLELFARFPFRWMPTPMIAAVEDTAGGVLTVRLKEPYAPFLEQVAGTVPIIPRHVWEGVADPPKYSGPGASLGSGPFQLAHYEAAAGAYRLTAHLAWWRGRPLVDEWQQLTVPAAARVEVVRRGEADISLSTDASVRELLAGDTRIRVFETAPLSLVRLVVNTERAPVDRAAVRQALMYALDRARIAEVVTRGAAIIGSAGVVPPESPWFNPGLRRYPYDPDHARLTLAGERLNLDLIADASAQEPELIQPMLAAVGITLTVRRVDAASRTQLLRTGDFQLALTSHIGVGGDPDYLRRWYAGEETNAFAQGSIFHNEEYDRVGREAVAALDPAERKRLVFRMQEILAEELPTLVLYYRRFYWVYDPTRFSPVATQGGLMDGIPFPNNKVALTSG